MSIDWYIRFLQVADILKRFYEHVLKAYHNDILMDTLKFVTSTEKIQNYPWTYIDYGFRVPVYRTIQWLSLARSINWSAVVNVKRSNAVKGFIANLYKHLSKEYISVWSTVLSYLYEEKKELSNIIKDVLKWDKEPIEVDKGAFEDLKGLRGELEACYVLIDHGKSFLPFSIMQAPMTPSYIRPGASSGDLYLFEENLVVDVKMGYLNKRTKLPIYYYGKRKNLFNDLKNVENLSYLYGIRKGIGVVAEDKDCIHLAVYVPWRRTFEEGPLLFLRSSKLPLLTYIHRDMQLHEIYLQNLKFSIKIYAYQLKDIDVNVISLNVLGKNGDELKISKPKIYNKEGRRFEIMFETSIEGSEEVKYVFEADNIRLVFANLVVGESILIPIISEVIR